MYTIDENGGLKIWEISQELGIVDLKGKSKSLRIQPRQLFAIVVENRLWTAALKSIDIYDLSADSQSFSCKKIEIGMGIGAITGITFLDRRQEVITSHECGKVTVYNAQTYERMYYVQLSSYKILSILAVGEAMVWVGFGTGKIIIYRINEKANWRAILDFPAYVNSGVVTLELDDTSLINTGNLTIMSLSDGGTVKFWNGLLTEYYKDIAIKAKCDEYCTYTPLNLLILTYNIDSRKPENMDESGHDSSLLAEFLATHDADLYVFGFQELVDLENVPRINIRRVSLPRVFFEAVAKKYPKQTIPRWPSE